MRKTPPATTMTDAVPLGKPPPPRQVNVYDAVALNGPTDSDPEFAFGPDHPPVAVHEVTSVEDQVSVTDEPETTIAALDVNVTDGVTADGVTATNAVRLVKPPAPEQPNV